MRRRRSVTAALSHAVLVGALAACGGDGQGAVELSGAIFTDFRNDMPCEARAGPRELEGVELVFRGPDGALIGRARTGPVEVRELAFGPGSEGWDHPGCRFFSRYAATLAPAASYAVAFDAPEPDSAPGGGYFEGVELLEPQVIAHDELAAQDFSWSFEAQPAFVVP